MQKNPNPYETDILLQQYLLLHFGDAEQTLGGLPGPREAVDFPARCARELLDVSRLRGGARALDIGCAVGGSCFELARSCDSVLGLDYSRGFLRAAAALRDQGFLETRIPDEAGKSLAFTARVSGEVDRSRVDFQFGDANDLDPALADFDVVLAANLLCRLPKPRRFLERLAGLVKPGGQLLLATPFSWTEDHTPREFWIGRDMPCHEELQDILKPAFVLEKTVELPFLLREHARRFQMGFSLGSRWIRK